MCNFPPVSGLQLQNVSSCLITAFTTAVNGPNIPSHYKNMVLQLVAELIVSLCILYVVNGVYYKANMACTVTSPANGFWLNIQVFRTTHTCTHTHKHAHKHTHTHTQTNKLQALLIYVFFSGNYCLVSIAAHTNKTCDHNYQ